MAEKKTLAERKEKINTVKKEIKKRVAQKIKPTQNTVTSNRLKLLVTVVGRRKAEYYTDLLQSFDINLQVVALASGTADAKMLNYLGLSDTDKTVIFSVIQENNVQKALGTLEEKFKTIKDGKGIAFTIPLSSVIGTLIYGFLSNNRTMVKEEKKNG